MILLIDNYDSFTYNLYQLLAAYDEVKIFRNDAITIEDIKKLSPQHIVISPGPGIPDDAGITKQVVEYCLESRVPLLGVCLGHQAIVEVLGGQVVLCDVPVHGKEARVFHHRQGFYANMPLPFRAGRYHSLHASKEGLPDELVVEAESGDGILMGVRHKKLPIYGVQFHPESILTPEGEQMIENFIRGRYEGID